MTTAETLSQSKTDAQSSEIIKKYVLWTSGIGLLPFPLFDMAGMVAAQSLMVKDLAEEYGVSFSDNLGKTAISSLLGVLAPAVLARGFVGSMVKAIPGVGSYIGFLTFPILAGASTYAAGKVFVKHFESGGDLLDFDAHKMKNYFREQFKRGKKDVEDLKSHEETPEKETQAKKDTTKSTAKK